MIRIITDSTSDFSLEEAKALDLIMMPLCVNFGDEHYLDKEEITNDEFYRKLVSSEEIPTTTLINPHDFTEMFNKYPEDDLVVILISKKLSGTYQSACIAKDALDRENIYIIDSKTVTSGLGLLVRTAFQYKNEGFSATEMVEKLTLDLNDIRIIAVFDTLKYLIKGGRITKVAGAVGTALNLKPIILVKDGVLESLTKVRGNRAAMKEVVRITKEQILIDESREICFAHTNSPTELAFFKQFFPYEGIAFNIGAIVGTHAGPGCVAITFFVKNK